MPTPPSYPSAHGLLNEQNVVITAAAGTGIGFALARRCIEEGANVLISDVHERRLGEAADRIEAETGRRPRTQICDVTSEDDVRALVAAGIEQLGHIDVWMNNAGLGGNAPIVEMTDDAWAKVLDITLTGTFRCLRAVLPHMYERGSGAVVNNASVLGWRAQELQSHYAAAKAGVMALTRCAAMEAAPRTTSASTRCRRASPCTRSWPRSPPTACSKNSSARPSAALPSRGRWPTSWSCWRATTRPT